MLVELLEVEFVVFVLEDGVLGDEHYFFIMVSGKCLVYVLIEGQLLVVQI